jgi:hypothetical protein
VKCSLLGQLKKEKLRKKKEQRKGKRSSVKVETVILDNEKPSPAAAMASPKQNGVRPLQPPKLMGAKIAKSEKGAGEKKERPARADQKR